MNVVIVGGGISGISAAKVILKQGHHATIIESTAAPGGLMARIANCRVGFKTFYDEIRMHPHLTVINEGRITAVEKKGEVFCVTLDNGQCIAGDRVVIAAGLTPYDPVDYKGRKVLTSLEYDALIDQAKADLPADFNRIAFVLCVGSRSKEYPCARRFAVPTPSGRSNGHCSAQSRILRSSTTTCVSLVRNSTWRRYIAKGA